VEAVEVRLGAGCDPTIKLDAVGGAHRRIADGVIAIDCGRAFAPSSTALGSVYILILHLPHALRSWIRIIADSSPLTSSTHVPSPTAPT
jgi:hypothetical protein